VAKSPIAGSTKETVKPLAGTRVIPVLVVTRVRASPALQGHPAFHALGRVVERTRVTTSTPESPAFPHAMVLTVSFVLPAIGLFAPFALRIEGFVQPGWPTSLRKT